MAKKAKTPAATRPAPIYKRIREILESARSSIARSVNTGQVVANWLVGREIVEEEQRGARKAGYGQKLIAELSAKLQRDFGGGYSATNLKLFRQFHLAFPKLILPAIGHPARDQLVILTNPADSGVPNDAAAIGHPARDQSWKPGELHPNLSWLHYRHFVRVESDAARSFYEIEAIQNRWSARELDRQINSLLFERLAKSKDKQGLLRLATKGQEIIRPMDIFKDPMVIEFVGLPESPKLQESDLETALLDNLQAFLLELGKGFAFIKRQERLTIDGDHFYVDLVFYHVVLKCFVLIDLKVGKLTHGDLGQLQLYVNYFDQERLSAGDNPTLGLILCTDKNDAVVKYTLGDEFQQKIFASRYKLHLPTEDELRAELCREIRMLPPAPAENQLERKPKKR